MERTSLASSVRFSSLVNCMMPGVSNFCRIHWHCSRSLMNMNSTPMCWQYAICSNREGKEGPSGNSQGFSTSSPQRTGICSPTGSQGQGLFISPFTLSAKEPFCASRDIDPHARQLEGVLGEPSCQPCNSPTLGALFELYSQEKGCGRTCSRMLQAST